MTRRRANGEGSISRHPKRDLYMGRFYVEMPDGTHKRRTVYGKTRKAVAEKMNEALANRSKGIVVDDENLTLGAWLDRWLEDSVRGNVGAGSLRQYSIHIHHHIQPSLGRVKLSRLNPSHIQALYAQKLRDGLAPATVRLTHAVLHRALDQAVKFNLIAQNPTARVDLPKIKQDEITPLDPEQARLFLDAASEARERYEALFTVALTVGLRIGEVLGLRWSDIDLEAGTLRVSYQLQRYPGKGLVLTEPKYGSRRTIALPQRALESLRIHRKRQAEERLRAGANWRDMGLVFASEIGTPLDARNVTHKHFKPLLKRAGLPNIRFHDLRHSCATILLSRGVHPTYVQNLLGHKSVKLTLDRYSHWMPSMGEQTAAAMEAALG
jgi:integrase